MAVKIYKFFTIWAKQFINNCETLNISPYSGQEHLPGHVDEGNCNMEKKMSQATKAIWHYWGSRVR